MVLGWPSGGKLVFRSLASPDVIDSVRLLGYEGKLVWAQTDAGTEITLPDNKMSGIAIVFAFRGPDLKSRPLRP
jgi:hypothetical protein